MYAHYIHMQAYMHVHVLHVLHACTFTTTTSFLLHTHVCTHTRAHTRMHAHTHTHTHAYTHTLGKDDSITSDLGMTAGVVLRLVEPICGLGHHLYTDNLYTSPRLYAELRLRGFEACGTLRLNRRDVPPRGKGDPEKGREEEGCCGR